MGWQEYAREAQGLEELLARFEPLLASCSALAHRLKAPQSAPAAMLARVLADQARMLTYAYVDVCGRGAAADVC